MTTPTESPSQGIIDVHSRVGPAQAGESRSVEAALREMDACGVARAWICPTDPYVAVRNVEGNDFIARAVREHPDRFVGCAVANPWYGDDALSELRRATDLGLRALFLHPPVQGFQLSNPLVDDLVSLAIRYGMTVYAHTGTPVCAEPFQLAALAGRHGRGKFIMGHMGFADFWYDAAEAAAIAPNVWLETSLMDGDVISQALRKLGANRLVFGSDAPVSAVDIEVEKIRYLEATGQDIERILCDNAKELLA
jgi:predicted TIM-barrel fold metal-dependent hydrolase